MSHSINIVHWNCRGFNAHGPEYIWSLSKQKHIPDIICLQETFFQNENDHPDITGYTLANFSTRDIKRGGTAIYCKTHINYTVRNINTKLEVSAIDIKLNNKLTTIVNVYDTDSKTTQSDYQNVFTQISDQFIVCGDFNAHHKLWGGRRNDIKGNHLYNHVIENNIVVLNDGTGTRLNPTNLETTCIDLSLVSTVISSHCTWYVDQKSTHGSDHFVVNVKITVKPMPYSNPYNSCKWNYKNADWKGFAIACDKKFSQEMVSDNIQETNSILTNQLIDIAEEYIPMKKISKKNQKPCVPWWDQNCTKVVRERNKARNRASHTGRGEDFIYYKEKEKLCKKLLHDTQQTYWENYCNSLNNNSNLSQVWYDVKKMLGNSPSKKEIPTLKQNDTSYECNTEKSNLFAKNFSKVSSTDNYNSQFKIHKQQVESKEHDNITVHFNNNSNCYNDKFTLQEIKDAISDTNNSAPGKDRLSYMFKHVSDKILSIFFIIY